MGWIFASVVLVLLVLHRGFRVLIVRTSLFLLAIAVLSGVGYGAYYTYDLYFGPKVIIDSVTYSEGSRAAGYAQGLINQRVREAAEQAEKQRADLAKDQAKKAEEAAIQSQLSRDFDIALTQVYERYPILDSSSRLAVPSAIDAALALTRNLINQGYKPAEAVKMAADQVGPQYENRIWPR